MYLQKVLTVFTLSYIIFSCSTIAHREAKRKLEILHSGKPLEELVSLSTHIDPHDIKGLAENVEPELAEETHQERVMLQENGIEDPYPLDATIEYENTKKIPKPIIATENVPKGKSSFTFEDPEDPRYESSDMPEYSVETKSDYKGNQEAAEWLMRDPNKFNIMPDEETKNLFSESKKLDPKSNDDPIRLDNDDNEDPQNQIFNDDDQQTIAKIQESLAPDTNMAKIYTKYEKYLDRFDQKLIDKNKNLNREHNFEIGDNAGYNAGDDNSEGNDVTITKVGANDESQINTNSLKLPDSDTTTVKDNNNKVSKFDHSVGKFRDGQENNGETSNNEEEESKVTVLKLLKDNLKVNKENKGIHAKVRKESSTLINYNDDDVSREDNTLHNNKLNDGIHQTSAISDSSDSGDSNLKTPVVVPVYRLSRLHKVHKKSPKHNHMPKIGDPLTEQGTSRQNVDMNRTPFRDCVYSKKITRSINSKRESFSMMNSFHRPPAINPGFGGIPQIMLSRGRDDNSYNQGMNSMIQGSTRLPKLEFNPQEPQDGQGRHGIPTRFGQWNGWSECTVSCDTGSQIRARICLRIPCQSRELYQTRKCIRDICPGKWRKESLRAHNRIRALHHSPPLVWSDSLAKKAKQLADILASKDYISSEDLHEEEGENIAQLRKTKKSGSLAKDAVNLWYNEIKSYSFSYPKLTLRNKHFVQMVWNKTKRLGMASTQSPSGEYTFVVALYGGPGINNKYLHYNVFRAGRKHDVYTTFKRSKIGVRHKKT